MRIKLEGYVSENGFWHTEIRLQINSENFKNRIDFMIDSCAEKSILSPGIAEKMGVGFGNLIGSREIPIGGAGCCQARKLNNVNIIFYDRKEDQDLIVPCHEMYVPEGCASKNPITTASQTGWQSEDYSVLGQDILSKFNIIANNKTKKIILIYLENTYIIRPHK